MSVIIYSKSNCPACIKAKAMLDKIGVAYEVKMVDRDMDAMDFIVEQGHRTMPQLYKNGAIVVEGGYAGMESLGEQELYKLLK